MIGYQSTRSSADAITDYINGIKDSDNDGYLDSTDALPFDNINWFYVDGDEVGDNNLVEIYLLDALEDSKNFFIDVVGYKADADPQRGLQAHKCYSNQEEITVDQGFERHRMGENEFFH